MLKEPECLSKGVPAVELRHKKPRQSNMTIWKMQDAKVQLSAIVKSASDKGPQFITLRGKPAAVILSQQDYDSLIAKANSTKK